MKSDLPRLMAERNLDAVVVEGSDGLAHHSAPWKYLTRNAAMHGLVVLTRGGTPTLLYHPMEQQQAEATGLALASYGKWDLKSIAKSHPTRLGAAVELYKQVFRDLGVAGRVGWYGAVEAASLLALADALRTAIPGLALVGEFENGVFEVARRTKDADEIAVMADVGRRTCAVASEVIDLIASHRARDGVLVNGSGKPLTIGAVKAFVRKQLDARDLDHDDCIFAQGRDAGIPHARGDEAAVVRTGQSIVFDLFPRCRRTGYHHDLTRTFAPGHADDPVQSAYDEVKQAFDAVVRDLRVGQKTKPYQDMTCAIFRAKGHLTPEDRWPLEEGYTHSLGHGLGLEVHEPLAFSSFADRGDKLEPGNVFTIEPGLYYPDRGLGVRVEDTYACDPDGTFRSLTPLPYDLVIPLRG